MSFSSSFVHEFLRRLELGNGFYPTSHASSWNRAFPNLGLHDASERERLVTTSQPRSFRIGTGASIFIESLLPAILDAENEVILVTCFWAPSKTLAALHDALTTLAHGRRQRIQEALARGDAPIPPLRFRICFSSRSLLQKLFHPQSRHGYVYPPSAWSKKLGLPDPDVLEAGGIQLQAKSLFFLPFSVMHPKFVIIDRRRAFVPSCNISWEAWLEASVELTGDAVRELLSFYSRTWEDPHVTPDTERGEATESGEAYLEGPAGSPSSGAHHHATFRFPEPVPTLVLPSASHRNPRFRPFPWQKAPQPPGTPLNVAVLQLLEQAERSIYLQTPNITCQSVLSALLDALARGVDVTVVTNTGMMLLEQLVTSGTTTSWCVRSLVRQSKRLAKRGGQADPAEDTEVGHRIGRLRVCYFRGRATDPQHRMEGHREEPVHSHLKLTVVDGRYVVLGSGNMDRASWYTSQELGILFVSCDFADSIKPGLDRALEGRLEVVFDSNLGNQ
ncbi:hypothetical protein VTJ83DRAFT_5252 [Remersonia thermophila]|uniref:PLD phosphodiesterase domain-containing protein n=1 Tax=Remersonia thermophila TaxID=72144 RepID=A0ABR4D6A5_9PEZI